MLLNEMITDENNIGYIPSLGLSFQTNKIGTEIINYIKNGLTKDEIVEKISEQYKIRYEDSFIDVSDFFSKLKIYGLI